MVEGHISKEGSMGNDKSKAGAYTKNSNNLIKGRN